MYDTARLDFRPRFFHAQMDCDTAFTGRSVEGMVSDLVRTERIRREGTEVSYLTSTNAYWQLLSNPKARLKRIDLLAVDSQPHGACQDGGAVGRQDGGDDSLFGDGPSDGLGAKESEAFVHSVQSAGERRFRPPGYVAQ